MPRHPFRPLVVALAIVAGLFPGAQLRAAGDDFIHADGEALTLHGAPWVAVGANLWDMDALRVLEGDLTACYYQHPDLDSYFDASFRSLSEQMHATVVRTFGFHAQYTDGGRDWSSTDKMLYYAHKWNVRVIPVLGNQYDICGSPKKGNSWYHCAGCTPGYLVPEQAWGISYRSYVVAAASRYRNDPAIAFWQLMNEPDPGAVGDKHDKTALVDFARDMVAAIRNEAGDQNHLISLGSKGGNAVGTFPPTYGMLMDCGGDASGGCIDVADIHDFNFFDPIRGTPLVSSVVIRIEAWNDTTNAHFDKTIALDTWLDATTSQPLQSDEYTNWRMQLLSPRTNPWTAYLDRVSLRTSSGAITYGFEGGTDDFSADAAALSVSPRHVRDGASALRLDLPASARDSVTTITPPTPGEAFEAISFSMYIEFNGPAPELATLISNLHQATVEHRRPSVMTEAGIQAQTPGLSKCDAFRSQTQRAVNFDIAMAAQMDADHRSGGMLAWDWKDPTLLAADASGGTRADPTIDCWSIMPGDPTIAILKKYADRLYPTPAMPVGVLPAATAHLAVLQAPSSEIVAGTDVPLLVRATRGGDILSGALVIASGACTGSGRTDGLGHVRFTCRATGSGPASVGLTLDAASCGCTPPHVSYSVTVVHAFDVSVDASVVEAGGEAALRIAVSDPSGAALGGLAWSMPACSRSGTLPQSASSVVLTERCPTAGRAGIIPVRFHVSGEGATRSVDRDFSVLAFARIYVDSSGRECVGLDPDHRVVGVSKATGTCGTADRGDTGDWAVATVSAAELVRAPGAITVTNASIGTEYSVVGTFSDLPGSRAFVSYVYRPDGYHVFFNAQ